MSREVAAVRLPIWTKTLQNDGLLQRFLVAHVNSSVNSTRPVAFWLLIVAALIFTMVTVGGVTRLTRSGLSIVEWNPVMGAVPPLNEHQWQIEFEKYQRTPEYQKVNMGMSLDAFRRIYYVEWTHRLLGRLIGVCFLIPLIYFALRRRVPAGLTPKLITIFILGGLQGALGWYMVSSGLVDIPRVSPYRLTAHLSLAIAIYAYIVWVALDLLAPVRAPRNTGRWHLGGWVLTGLIALMIVAGGFVAGTKAGFVFNTFPLMNGHLIPEGMYALNPWWANLFENVATVQFNHRILAYLLLIATGFYWWTGRRRDLSAPTRRALNLLLAAVVAQATLGVTTLLSVVPVGLGALHQAGALVVLTLALYLNHTMRAGSH